MFSLKFIILCNYPRPTPATYPRGLGIPRKCFLFLFANAAAAIFAIFYRGF